jgi:hypothetical protein
MNHELAIIRHGLHHDSSESAERIPDAHLLVARPYDHSLPLIRISTSY